MFHRKKKTFLSFYRSLKCIDEFIIDVGNEIYELTERKMEVDKYKEKELQRQKQVLINQLK